MTDSNSKIFVDAFFIDLANGAIKLSNGVFAFFKNSVFLKCYNDKEGGAIYTTGRSLSLVNCMFKECLSNKSANMIFDNGKVNSELYLSRNSFSKCGDLLKGMSGNYINVDLFETSETNASNCMATSYTIFDTDQTIRGSFHQYDIIAKNLGHVVIFSLEKQYNIMKNSVIIENGNSDLKSLIYSSESSTEYKRCLMNKNTGFENFYLINQNNIKLSFHECYIQESFGSRNNNILQYCSDSVSAESFNDLITILINIHHIHSKKNSKLTFGCFIQINFLVSI